MVNTGAPIPDGKHYICKSHMYLFVYDKKLLLIIVSSIIGATAVIEIKNTKKVNKKVIKKCDNNDNKEYCEEEEIEILSQSKEEENIKYKVFTF